MRYALKNGRPLDVRFFCALIAQIKDIVGTTEETTTGISRLISMPPNKKDAGLNPHPFNIFQFDFRQ